MGWFYESGATRESVIAEYTKGWGDAQKQVECLRHCTRGNTLWTLYQITEGETVTRTIGCILLGRSRGDWGAKAMDESMGPYQYSCPEDYLTAATDPPNEWAATWRAKVRAYHAARRQKARMAALQRRSARLARRPW